MIFSTLTVTMILIIITGLTTLIMMVYLLSQISWFIFGKICELMGEPSNDLLYLLSLDYVYDVLKNTDFKITYHDVINKKITDIGQINTVLEFLKMLKTTNTNRSFRQRYYDRSWINFYRKDVIKARKTLEYLQKSVK